MELQNTKNFRKPIGIAACDISDKFSFLEGNVKREILNCNFMLGSEGETLETTFKKFQFDKRAVFDKHALQVQFEILYDNDNSSHEGGGGAYGGGHVPLAKKLGLPEVIFHSNVRNDLYVNILQGELGR